jgi:hypothetical protein
VPAAKAAVDDQGKRIADMFLKEKSAPIRAVTSGIRWHRMPTLLRVTSLRAGLAGWRRSADSTRLHKNSLLTGNFTGNFTILDLWGPVSPLETAALQALLRQFPAKTNREIISGNRDTFKKSREFMNLSNYLLYLPNPGSAF